MATIVIVSEVRIEIDTAEWAKEYTLAGSGEVFDHVADWWRNVDIARVVTKGYPLLDGLATVSARGVDMTMREG